MEHNGVYIVGEKKTDAIPENYKNFPLSRAVEIVSEYKEKQNGLNYDWKNWPDEKLVAIVRKALDESGIPYTITDNGRIDFDGLPSNEKEV